MRTKNSIRGIVLGVHVNPLVRIAMQAVAALSHACTAWRSK
ncbi:MAG TPA: hypothetical protein VK524_03580 [Polyangiaceae bacterium]|nr:hypothetical protein [Polyangiaceae bacterium]